MVWMMMRPDIGRVVRRPLHWYLGEKGVEGLAMPTGQSRAGVSGEVPTCG